MNNSQKDKKICIFYLKPNEIEQIEYLKEKWNMKTRSKVMKKCLEKQMALEKV